MTTAQVFIADGHHQSEHSCLCILDVWYGNNSTLSTAVVYQQTQSNWMCRVQLHRIDLMVQVGPEQDGKGFCHLSQPRIFCLAACKLSPTFSPAASYLQHNTHTTCTQLHAYVTKQVLIPRDLWTNTTLALSNNWDNKAVPLPNVHTWHISSICMHLRALALRIICITLSGAVRPWLI